jgi:phenylacetate-CoA ligase
MSIQSLVMSKPALATLFMSRASEAIHENSGRRTASRALEAAIRRTVAYPAFLIENGIDPERALSPEVFGELPLMDKKSYVERFPLQQRVLDGKLASGYTIEKSSGYSGATNYWLRTPEEDALIPSYMEFAFRQFYRLDLRSTLLVMGMALGTWTAGMKLSQALREVAATGKYPLTVITPGIDLDEILQTVGDLSSSYDQTVIVAYPPFAKVIIDEGIRRGIDWKSLNVRLAVGGEGFSEEWRAHLGDKLGHDTSRDLLAVSSGFGAADLGASVGREYPVTVLIRQLAAADTALARELFGGGEVPSLFQYSPSGTYIEEVDGQLVFTVKSGVPLVRYAIGDRGGVIPFGRMTSVLEDHGYDVAARLQELGYERGDLWRLPFFYCLGRTDGVVFVGGVNVYPENVATALSSLDDEHVLGHKLATTLSEDGFTQRLLVLVEYKADSLSDVEREQLAARYRPVIVDGIARDNSEYRRLRQVAAELAEPVVHVYPTGGGPFAEDVGKIKRKYVL